MIIGRLAAHCTSSFRSLHSRRIASPLLPCLTGTSTFPRSDFKVARRGLSANADPYKTLGVPRDASEEDVKRAFRKKALETHPDKNPELPREQAEEAFARLGNAYEILKDSEKRQQYDRFGSVGESGGGPSHEQRTEHARMVHEWMRAIQQQHARQQQQPPPKVFPQPDMEAWVRADVESIHTASRACSIDTEYDERRARHAGKLGVIARVDPSDQTCKVRLMVSPGRAEELWFGLDALWDPRLLTEGLEVRICPDVEAVHRASRESGIDAQNDSRRARCGGKVGAVIKVDHSDQTAKLRVLVTATRADELWFPVAAIEPRDRRR